HVKSVRYRRRNLGIASGCRQRQLGERWIVVGVDNVVDYPWMIRHLRSQLVEYCGGVELLREGLVGRRRRRDERERIEDGSLRIVGAALEDLLHRLLIGLGASPMVEFVWVFVEGLDGPNVIPFALGLRT